MTRITGAVRKHSRLFRYLKNPKLRKAAHLPPHPELHAYRLGGSHEVYLIREGKSHKKFILKSFLERDTPTRKSARHMAKEYGALTRAHRIIDDRDWVRVARPLCKSDAGDFFAEQYVAGTPLGDYMREAMIRGRGGELHEKLTMLAGFLGLLHKKTRRSSRIRASGIRGELKKHARQASLGGAFTPKELEAMERLIDEACSYRFIDDAKRTLVHGDANPSNFLFGRGRLYVLDMERAGYRDPVYDLGMLAGELFHYAMRYGGDPYKADPFIGHLYWFYAGNFEDQWRTFIETTRRNPLYMANSLLRIARHPFFSRKYKRRLAYHAGECLKSLGRFNRGR
ncbi:MAG TPA: aminoglycoside phosphotransferase family protein [Methanocella sp.]|nr:aminoglycoside phosphotransferase family protein [Methanocella sp.]